jgi:murein DD-endopeptidase MepM/ murein hydrolase activator NlpD
MRRLVLGSLAALLSLAPATTTPAASPAAGPDGSPWRPPLAAAAPVVRGFDPPEEPWLPGHRGVDLAGRAGSRVRAAGTGVVVFAGVVAGVGVVSVRHANGLLTTYQPVATSVGAGEQVVAGTVLGRLASSGSHCAPDACLHWGLRRGVDYLDPMLLVAGFTVRLVPLDRSGEQP